MKNIFIDFVDDLQRLSKKYPIGLTDIDLLFCKTYISSLAENTLIDGAVKNVLPYGDQIRKRDLSFFQNQKNSLFKGLPEDKLDQMANALTGGKVPPDAISTIWDHVEVILLVTELAEQRK